MKLPGSLRVKHEKWPTESSTLHSSSLPLRFFSPFSFLLSLLLSPPQHTSHILNIPGRLLLCTDICITPPSAASVFAQTFWVTLTALLKTAPCPSTASTPNHLSWFYRFPVDSGLSICHLSLIYDVLWFLQLNISDTEIQLTITMSSNSLAGFLFCFYFFI